MHIVDAFRAVFTLPPCRKNLQSQSHANPPGSLPPA